MVVVFPLQTCKLHISTWFRGGHFSGSYPAFWVQFHECAVLQAAVAAVVTFVVDGCAAGAAASAGARRESA